MIYLANAFSLQMIPVWRHAHNLGCSIHCAPLLNPEDYLSSLGGYVSCVGHKDVAALMERQLNGGEPAGLLPVEVRRQSIELSSIDDILVVAQYTGPRLPEGATQLPEGASLRWWKITLDDLGEYTP